MAWIQDQSLAFRHFIQVLHCQPELGPVLEGAAVAPVSDEFLRKLSDCLVQVIHYHRLDSGAGFHLCGVPLNRVRLYFKASRSEPIHVNVSVFPQFLQKLFAQLFVQRSRKITERIFYCESFFRRTQLRIARGTVRHRTVKLRQWRQRR